MTYFRLENQRLALNLRHSELTVIQNPLTKVKEEIHTNVARGMIVRPSIKIGTGLRP